MSTEPIQPALPAKKTNVLLWVLIASSVGCGGIMFLGVCAGLLLPAVQAAREAARRNQCMNHSKQIAVALQNYHDQYQTFPPAFIADADGKPMHSWRVLILPYIEEKALYDQYKFDEPWDGPNNSKLAEKMPELFRCPTDPGNPPFTNYVAVVGPQTAWPGSTGRPLRDFADGASRTILVAETADSNINWMEPRDITFDAAKVGINVPDGISSHHPGGIALVTFADGHVSALADDTPPGGLEAMLTVAGGEAEGSR